MLYFPASTFHATIFTSAQISQVFLKRIILFMMLCNRVSNAQLLQRRVVVSAPFLRPLTCHAAAEATPEAATTSVKVCGIDVCIEAVVVSVSGRTGIQLSTKALELVPGQMKTDKQAVFANATEGLAQYLVSKKEIMEQRRQALSRLQQVGSVVTGTAKLRRKDGWLVALDGVSALVRNFNLKLEQGQSVQILITDISQQSAMAIATTRFEKGPDGTYEPLPRLRAKSAETKTAAEQAAEPAAEPALNLQPHDHEALTDAFHEAIPLCGNKRCLIPDHLAWVIDWQQAREQEPQTQSSNLVKRSRKADPVTVTTGTNTATGDQAFEGRGACVVLRCGSSGLPQRRVVVSAPFLRPLTCHAAAEATPEAATTSVKVCGIDVCIEIDDLCSGKVTKISPSMAFVTLDNNVKGRLHVSMISKERVEAVGDVFSVGDELKAVVVSTNNDTEVQLSTKALELVPGQMKTDKQAVFANAAEGLAQHLVSKKEIMEQRQQALSHLQVGSVVTGTAKLRRRDGWLVALDGVSALVRRIDLDQDLERGQSVQILITDISQQSALAIATTRFEQKPDGTYQPLPRPAKLTEIKAATKPAAEPAAEPA
ncbi:hypothetical protein QJQ45_002187 [Haematococcus lacustris]|nr:hypothetical protein QJQ45_002187 [Haematococcus lacustris]